MESFPSGQFSFKTWSPTPRSTVIEEKNTKRGHRFSAGVAELTQKIKLLHFALAILFLGCILAYLRRQPVNIQPPDAIVDTGVSAVPQSSSLHETSPAAEVPRESPLGISATVSPLSGSVALQSDALFEQAENTYRRRQYQQAIPLFEEALRLDPHRYQSRLSLGVCLLRVGRGIDALREFERAKLENPSFAPTYFNIACYYAASGKTEEALDALSTTFRLDPNARRWARDDADLAALRHDSRFEALLR